MFDSEDVKKAISVYGKMLDYQNSDHSALSWDAAASVVMLVLVGLVIVPYLMSTLREEDEC